LPSVLAAHTGGARTIEATGRTLGEAVADVAARYPALAHRLRDKEGKPYPFVNFYLNDEDVRFRGGFAAPVQDGDEVTVIPAIGERNSRPFTISNSSAGATPYLRASANASPIASIAAASRKLPASLITLARGGSSPATITPWPMASSTRPQRWSACGGPAAT